jgi:FeS assembly SUF system regulator
VFKLNRMTDYGVVVIGHLADSGGAVQTTPEIAEATGLKQPTVAKLLKLLAQGGLVTSHRGARGGYSLARPAGEISVAAAIEALEGPLGLTACVEGSHDDCGHQSLCPMTGRWNKVDAAIRAALESVSLAYMTAPLFGVPRMNDRRSLRTDHARDL